MRLTTLYALLVLTHIGFADQVTLKNGDRLSGAIQGTGQVKEALPLAVLLRGSGYGYLK